MSDRKVLVIGLDGVPFRLLDELFSRNVMPFLKSMRESGYSAGLLSTVPPISAPAWTTFVTGTNPGEHGILHFVSLRPGKVTDGAEAQWVFPDTVSLLSANDIRGASIWQRLSDAGRRQIVVNVPLTYPPRTVNGVMITGMLTPPSARVFTHPPELSQRLLDAGYEVDLAVHEKDFDFDPDLLVRRVTEVLAKRRDACLQLMQGEPWDFFMVVFMGTDRLQHHFWKYLVPGDPLYSSPGGEHLRPALDQYFRQLDETIAALVSAAGPDVTTLVLSDHGFGPMPDRALYTLSLMRTLGLEEGLSKSGVVRFRKFVEGRLGVTPGQMRAVAKALMPRAWAAKVDVRVRNAQLAAGARNRAYVVAMHSYIGGVYINQDHFPEDSAFLAFRDRVLASLRELTDPETSQRLVARAHVQEELYAGSALEECPDIVFYLADGYGLADGVGPSGALVGPRRRHLKQQGVHRDEGIFILNGPYAAEGRGPQEKLLDVTASLLYLLGAPTPSSMESRPITRALRSDFVSEHPLVFAEVEREAGKDKAATDMTQEDQDELVERLRGLGYIE